MEAKRAGGFFFLERLEDPGLPLLCCSALSEALQQGQQLIIRSIAAGLAFERRAFGEGLLFYFGIGMQIDRSGFYREDGLCRVTKLKMP